MVPSTSVTTLAFVRRTAWSSLGSSGSFGSSWRNSSPGAPRRNGGSGGIGGPSGRPAGDAAEKKSAQSKAQDAAREEGLKARRRWNKVKAASGAGELAVESGGDGSQGLITFAAQRLIFDNALAAAPRERTRRQKSLLIEKSDTIQYLSKFPNKVLYNVWGELQLETYHKDVRVINQGDEPDKFYIVLSGLLSIRIWKKADTEAAQRIKRLRLLAMNGDRGVARIYEEHKHRTDADFAMGLKIAFGHDL